MRYQTAIPIRLETSTGIVILKPGDTFRPSDENTIKGLLAEGKVKPVRQVMTAEFKALTSLLKQFDLGSDELKERLPALYQDIQVALEKIDNAFVQEDLAAFQSAVNEVKGLYAEALFTRRQVAIKVYSELLDCNLWLVATEKDMKALRQQGVKEAIYTAEEIKRLSSLGKDFLNGLHRFKEVFSEGTIEEINKKSCP